MTKAALQAGSNSQNPVIEQSGQASITSGQYLTWNSANGASSTMAVYNQDKANNCVVVITGAPKAGLIVMVNGVMQTAPLDNIYTIAPNNPNNGIIAMGNFGGSSVTITNVTNPQFNATALIITQVPAAGTAFEAFLRLTQVSLKARF